MYTDFIKNNGGAGRTTFVKMNGAALAQLKKQAKTGATQVYRLNGRSEVARTTALIESARENSSRFAIVRLDKGRSVWRGGTRA
jgi:hypothetical protein